MKGKNEKWGKIAAVVAAAVVVVDSGGGCATFAVRLSLHNNGASLE